MTRKELFTIVFLFPFRKLWNTRKGKEFEAKFQTLEFHNGLRLSMKYSAN